jgi:hypothetical protein
MLCGVLMVALVPACSSDFGNECRPRTSEELADAVVALCDSIVIEGTDLSSLEGMENLDRAADIHVLRNQNLSDVSQLINVQGQVELSNNESLLDAHLGTVREIYVNDQDSSDYPDHQMETISFTAPPRGSSVRLLVTQNGASGSKLSSIHVDCSSSECSPVEIDIAARGGFAATISVENVEFEALALAAPFQQLEQFQDLGVPTANVRVNSFITRSLAEEYLEWLISHSFSGHFSACVYDIGDPPAECTDDTRLFYPE